MQPKTKKRRQRKSVAIAATAAATTATMALMGWSASSARASLVVDLRAVTVNGVSTFNKNINASVGSTICLDVVVRVSGTNATQSVGDFDGSSPANDTRNDDTFSTLTGAFQSSGFVKGDFSANNFGGGGLTLAPYSGAGAQAGAATDFDSDGDLDLGALGSDPTNMWYARANAPQTATSSQSTTLGTRLGSSAGNTFVEDVGGPNAHVPNTRIIDATTDEILVGELVWHVTGGGGHTRINFVSKTGNDAATWFEDGSATQKNPGNSPFAVGAPVDVHVINDLYWDTNGAAAGAGGSTPAGTWDSSTANWANSAGGAVSPQQWVAGGTAHFSAGADATGSFTVALSGTQVADGLLFEEGNVTLNGGQLTLGSGGIDVSASASTTIISPIGGADGLTKTGAGTLTLSGNNTFTGGVTISGGTLLISSDSNLGSSFNNLTFSGGMLKSTVSSLTISQPISLLGPSPTTFDQDAGTVLTLSGNIGFGALVKSGAGTLVLFGNNTYSGGTTVNAGTLQIRSSSNLGTGSVTFNGGILSGTATSLNLSRFIAINGGGATFNQDVGTGLTLSGSISGAGGLTKIGSGTLALTGAGSSTYGGGTFINGGTLQIAADFNLGGTSTGVTFNGGTLQSTAASLASGRSITINAGGGTFNQAAGTSLQLNGTVSGGGTLAKSGAGTLTIFDYAGPVNVADGILTTNGTTLGPVTLGNTANAKLAVNHDLAGIGPLSGGGTSGGAVDLLGNLVDLHQSTDTTFAGNITDGELRQSGAGTITLTGSANTVDSWLVDSGGTRLTGGALTAGLTEVGEAGVATFTQTGGTHTVNSDLIVGELAGANGTYSISNSGSVLNVSGNAYLGGYTGGAGGTATLNISGGTMSVSGALKIFNTAGTSLNLSGGTLSAASLDTTANPSHFFFTGGTLKLTGNGSFDDSTHQIVNTATLLLQPNLASSTVMGPAGGLTIASGGTLTLDSTGGAFDAKLTGDVTNNGTIRFRGGSGGARVIDGNVINNGAIAANNGATAQLSANSLTLNSGSQLFFNLAAPGTSNRINVLNASGLTLGSTSVTLTNAGGEANGTYTLIDYNTAYTNPLANLQIVSTPPSGSVWFLQDDTVNTNINLVIEQQAVVWTGNGGAGVAWLTPANWSGGVLPDQNQTAQFGSGHNTNAAVGINMNTAGGSLAVGSILLDGTANHDLTIENSSGSADGTLILKGVGGVALSNDSTDKTLKFTQVGSGGHILGLRLDANAGIINVTNAAANINILSVVSGTGGFNKTGSGTLTLSAANTYTGTTTLAQGTLAYGADNALSGDTINISAGATLNMGTFSQSINGVSSFTNNGTVTGSGLLSVRGSSGFSNVTNNGNLSLGSLTYGSPSPGSSASLSNQGTLIVNALNSLSNSNSSTLNNSAGATLSVSSLSLQGSIDNSGAMTIGGGSVAAITQTAGTLTVNGALSGFGNFAINGGTMALGGTLSVTLNGRQLNLNGGTLAPVTAGNAVTVSLSNGASFIDNSGTITASAVNLTGSPVLGFGNTPAAGTFVFQNSGTLNGPVPSNATITVAAGATAGSTPLTNNGSIGGPGGISIPATGSGEGTLTNNAGGTVNVASLSFQHSASSSGATLDNKGSLTASSLTTSSDTFADSVTNEAGATMNVTSVSVPGNISNSGTATLGSGNVAKLTQNAGTMTVTGNVTGIGDHTVNGGTLALGGTLSVTLSGRKFNLNGGTLAPVTAGNPVTISLASGASFVNNSGSITASAVNLISSPTLTFGSTPAAGNFVFQNSGSVTTAVPAGSTVTAQGSAVASAGVLVTLPATVTNNGTLALDSVGVSSNVSFSGNVTNAGTIRYRAGAGGGRRIAGAVSGAGKISGNDGAPATLALDSLTLSTGATLEYDLASTNAAASNDLLNVAGHLSLDGNVTLNLNAYQGDVADATYKLISYSGSLTGNVSGWSVGASNASSAHTYSFSSATAGEIDLIVGVGSAGGVLGEWLGPSSSGGAGNWSDSAKWGQATVPGAGAHVLIDNGRAASSAVTLDQNATVSDVTLDGADSLTIIPGKTLMLAGSAATSVFTGTLTNNGTVAVTNGSTARLLGSATHSGSFTIAAGATLDFAGGAHTFPAGVAADITGTGTMNISGATVTASILRADNGMSITMSSGALNSNVAEVVGRDGVGSFTQTGGVNTLSAGAIGESLYLGFASTSTGTYTISGGTLSLDGSSGAGPLILGYDGTGTMNVSGAAVVTSNGGVNLGLNASALGTINQSGGALTVQNGYSVIVGRGSGSHGVYNLTNGTVHLTGPLVVGADGSGTITQSGGDVQADLVVYLGQNAGSTGTYTMSGTAALTISGAGRNVNVGGSDFGVGGTGVLNLNGGTLTAGSNSGVQVWPTGTLNLNGGNLNASTIVGGTMNVGSGTLTAAALATLSATVTQTGGSVGITGFAFLGRDAATTTLYNLSGAASSFAANDIEIAYNGDCTFNQNGGTVQANFVTVANNAGSHGNYYLTAGALNVGTLFIGPGGNGQMNRAAGAAVTVSTTHIGPTGKLSLDPSGGTASPWRTDSLLIDVGGILDLGDNKLIVRGTNATGSWNGSSYTGVTGLIRSGRNEGNWSGSGIVTSQSLATSSTLTSIGIATASQVKGIAATATTVWGGQTVTGDDTLVMYTYGGDANLDGKIDVLDYGRIDLNVPLGVSGWFNGDFNYDGKIDVLDYGIIDFNIGIQGPAFSTTERATGTAAAVAVPEPTISALVISLAAIHLPRCRRRRGKVLSHPHARAP